MSTHGVTGVHIHADAHTRIHGSTLTPRHTSMLAQTQAHTGTCTLRCTHVCGALSSTLSPGCVVKLPAVFVGVKQKATEISFAWPLEPGPKSLLEER